MSSIVLSTFLSALVVASGALKAGISNNVDEESSASTPANIIFIMMDDLGRTDIGSFGAEWETPNIDNFLQQSVTLKNHYVSYVCSVSRSQFLTGRYSFHSGIGTLNVFDIQRLGYAPFQTPMLQEYLKLYGDYGTYAIGKWQLGGQVFDSFAVERGFDHFYGYNGGIQDYYTKDTNNYVDFWEDFEPTTAWCGEYSTDQYFGKMTQVIEEHNEKYQGSKPFFVYLSLQAIHDPFPKYEQENLPYSPYYQYCMENYNDAFDYFDLRISVCEAMLAVDTGFGDFLDFIQNNEDLKKNNIWENTLIVFTSDNGGSFDAGSCNYPFRGGKNTFFEGNVNVLAAAGGGILPESQKGLVLDGLVSNIDWVPTFLAFANIIPTDQAMVTFNEDSKYLSLDGYNLYNYLTKSTKDASESLRDHIIFHLQPSLTEDTNEFTKDISEYSIEDFDEIAMIFYDDNGILWKYIDAGASTNVIGDPSINSGWCETGTTKDNTYELTTDDDFSESLVALFNLNNDVSESNNFLEIDGNDNQNIVASQIPQVKALKPIMEEKIGYFTKQSENLNANYLFGSFFCFFDSDSHFDEAEDAAKANGQFWVPFFTGTKQMFHAVSEDCGLDEEHPIYKLFTSSWNLPSDVKDLTVNDDMNLQMKETIKKHNQLVPTQIVNVNDEEKLNIKNSYAQVWHGVNKNISVTAGVLIVVAVIIAVLAIVRGSCLNDKLRNKMNGYVQV